MTGSLIGTIIIWLVVAVVVIAVIVYLLNWLYHRSTKEVAFVRTGFGKETVVIDGGALVLPIIHEITPVNLNVVRIPVSRTKEDAVITRDRIRVDLDAEFFVRVIQEPSAVAAAASTLGALTMDPDGLAHLVSGKFVSSLRSVAAEMTVDEMHERRGDFVTLVQERAAGALAMNGLELEFVAITDLDQTSLEFFDPANRFDAEGLTILIEDIEQRRRLRNDIEQTAMTEIRKRNLEAERETLMIDRESESSRLDQERELEAKRATQRTEIARKRFAAESEAERSRIASEEETRTHEIAQRNRIAEAEINANLEVEQIRIAQERTLETARVEREQVVREAEIRRQRALENLEIQQEEEVERSRVASDKKLREERILADETTEEREIARNRTIEAARIEAQEKVETARITQEQVLDEARINRDAEVSTKRIARQREIDETDVAAREEVERARITSQNALEESRVRLELSLKLLETEREQSIELSDLARRIAILGKEAEVLETRLAVDTARARSVEAEERVATVREKEIARRITEIDRVIAEKDADVARIAAEAERTSAAVAAEAQRLLNEAENILTGDARIGRLRAQFIERLESIIRESVRPLEKIEGIRILHVDGLGPASEGGNKTPTDQVIESALRYRVQAPLIDEMMKEIGVENSNVSRMGDLFRSARDAQSIAKEVSTDKGEKDES